MKFSNALSIIQQISNEYIYFNCCFLSRIKNEEVLYARRGEGTSSPFSGHGWGRGSAHLMHPREKYDGSSRVVINGGIYVANSVQETARAWNCQVRAEEVGEHGDIEHLRGLLPPGKIYARKKMNGIKLNHDDDDDDCVGGVG